MAIKHPYTKRPDLIWQEDHNYAHKAVVVGFATYKTSGRGYHTNDLFAIVRPVYGGDGLVCGDNGWVVSFTDVSQQPNTFDFTVFDKIADAKLHVEAVFALEFS